MLQLYNGISYTYDDRITRLYLRFGFISAVLLFTACILIAAAIYLLRVSTRKSWDSRKAKKILAVSIASLAVLVVAIVWAYPFPSGTLAEAHPAVTRQFKHRGWFIEDTYLAGVTEAGSRTFLVRRRTGYAGGTHDVQL